MTSTQLLIRNLLLIATFAPLVSSLVIILLTRRVLFKAAGWLAVVVMAGSFLCAFYAMLQWLGMPADQRVPIVSNLKWIPLAGNDAAHGQATWLYLGIMVDGLTIAMMTMVTFISMLVHLY